MIASILAFINTGKESGIDPLELHFRKPSAEDGADIWELVRDCPPLDENSLYCNILQADHFADTCIAAEHDGRIVGWVSGYRSPKEKNTLFIWQVAVHADARGIGLGKKLLSRLLARRACTGVNRLKTTITPDNEASWGMFRSFAKDISGRIKVSEWLTKERHFAGQHDSEHLVTISFPPRQPSDPAQGNHPGRAG